MQEKGTVEAQVFVAIYFLLCYPTPKQTVSKILCGKSHIQRFSQTLAKNPKTKQQEKGELGEMCNLGEAILERGIEQGLECGIEQGIEQGIEKGRVLGIEQGIQQGIQAYIELCREMGISREETKFKTWKKFELQEKTAEEYVKQYYNE